MSTSQILRLTRKLELTAEQEQDFLDAMQAGDRSRSALVITPKAPEGYLPPLPAEETPRDWGHPHLEILPAQFGTEAGILGSAHLALNTHFGETFRA